MEKNVPKHSNKRSPPARADEENDAGASPMVSPLVAKNPYVLSPNPIDEHTVVVDVPAT
jgi:hypothetical protein